MSFLVELPTESGMRLRQESLRQGVSPAEIVQRLVADYLPDIAGIAGETETVKTDMGEAEQKRIEAIDATMGKYAYLGPMVEDLHRERQADREREERAIAEYTP